MTDEMMSLKTLVEKTGTRDNSATSPSAAAPTLLVRP